MNPNDAISEADLVEDDDDDPEPMCAECGCNLFSDEHAFDCSYGDEEANEDEADNDKDDHDDYRD